MARNLLCILFATIKIVSHKCVVITVPEMRNITNKPDQYGLSERISKIKFNLLVKILRLGFSMRFIFIRSAPIFFATLIRSNFAFEMGSSFIFWRQLRGVRI